jgi:hypothetical protein
LMFSTFLNPFFGVSATALVLLALPAMASRFLSDQWSYIMPVYSLTMTVLRSSFRSPGNPSWLPIGLALVETVAFWVLAARIFAYVDIAVAVE